jgi:hypothetical protein
MFPHCRSRPIRIASLERVEDFLMLVDGRLDARLARAGRNIRRAATSEVRASALHQPGGLEPLSTAGSPPRT